jgi:phenylalanyl-tRNA synthetase beta chain
MKASVNWLRRLAGGVAVEPGEIAERLTAAGLEVEGIARFGDFAGVVAAEILSARRHPKSDKLWLVEVSADGAGRERAEVVCGAPELPPTGAKVAWARPGARIAGGRTIEAREVRGVTSPGMLCAEDELGLGSSHEGLLVLDGDLARGADVAAALGLPDTIFELNVTPNRPDWLGHLGVARELAAVCRALSPAPRLVLPPAELADLVGGEEAATLAAVELRDAEGCPRYLARLATGVTVGPSPLRVRLVLQALGVRAINNVVDATNLALLETGHPLHAFDLDRLEGRRIVVRRARDGEPIVTLDGQERRLAPEDVAICDAERPVAVAGVMGGRDSEVGPGTRRILLESAYFDPRRIRRTARRLCLHTEASHRFERGADPNAGVAFASARTARLIAELSGARLARGEIDAYPRPISPATVELRPARMARVVGTVIPVAEQVACLEALGLRALAPADDGRAPGEAPARISVEVPTFRPDLTREIDLIEEVARLRGYDGIPATLPRSTVVARDERDDRDERAREALVALGCTEAITYAFVGPDRIAALGASDWRARPLRIANPLREEQSALRTSLVPGLALAAAHNLSHGVADVRLFEVGKVFRGDRDGNAVAIARHLPPEGRDHLLPEEHRTVGGVLVGRREGWLKPGEELDFFDVKGVVEALLEALGSSARFGQAQATPWLHPRLAATVDTAASAAHGRAAGFVGELHPDVRERFGIAPRAFVFELDLGLLGAPDRVSAAPPPRFPGSARDLSFFVEREVPAADLQATMAAASSLLEAVRPLEDYREAGRVPAGRKGMLYALLYRARDRTLTDEEVGREHAAVVDALRARYAIELR